MGTIMDYIREYGQYSFYEKTFNEVDSLVLSQLVYLKYGHCVAGLSRYSKSISLEEIDSRGDRGWLFIEDFFKEDNIALWEACLGSVRFQKTRLNYYVDIVNFEHEMQFCAVTFLLEDHSVYLAFRGTDETIVGWKEDFNLAFSDIVHSQKLCVEYVERVAGFIASGFYVGGHSKGGNLAVYAGMYCDDSITWRFREIYNHDGPGFRPEVRTKERYQKIAAITHKYIPRSSIIGIILESHAEYDVVESGGFGVMQHNPFSWTIEEEHFKRTKEGFTKRFMDKALNEWIYKLTEDEIHSFVDTLYNVLTASGAADFIEFRAHKKQSRQLVKEAIREIDAETRKVIWKVIGTLFEVAGEAMWSELTEGKKEDGNK